MRLLRDTAQEIRRDESATDDETRHDIPTLAALQRFAITLADSPVNASRIAPQSDLERATRLQRDTAEYASALILQLDVIVAAYDAALARWKAAKDSLEERVCEEQALTAEAVGTIERQAAYVDELESALCEAWEKLESVEAAVRESSLRSDFYRNELAIEVRASGEREKRLTIALHEAQQSEQSAMARADHEMTQVIKTKDAEIAALQRRADEQQERADWAADERARLAKCYEDACAEARHITQSLDVLDLEMTQSLAAKDAEIAALQQRCAELETTLLGQINASIAAAKEESQRLSSFIDGVQQGKFWRLKRVAQRFGNLVHR